MMATLRWSGRGRSNHASTLSRWLRHSVEVVREADARGGQYRRRPAPAPAPGGPVLRPAIMWACGRIVRLLALDLVRARQQEVGGGLRARAVHRQRLQRWRSNCSAGW